MNYLSNIKYIYKKGLWSNKFDQNLNLFSSCKVWKSFSCHIWYSSVDTNNWSLIIWWWLMCDRDCPLLFSWISLHVCLLTLNKSCHLSSDLSVGSWVAGASCRMLHPNGGSTESHPGSDADHKATQRQPRCLPEAQHAALQPRRSPRVTQVSFVAGINKQRWFSRQSHAN